MKSLFSLVSCVFGFVVSVFSERSFQMKTQMLVALLAVVVGVFGGVGLAQQCVVLDVPYIHQVRDIGVDGRNMCVGTSAVMLVEGDGLQPVNTSSYKGWYVYNGYGDFVDFLGENYSTRLAGDWDKLNYVAGAHGFIATELSNGDWVGDRDRLIIYLENHGLETKIESTNLFTTIQREINAGRPVLARFPLGNDGGHYVVVTGVAGPNLVVVNDPNGNKYLPGWGTESNGKNVVYNINDSRTQFSWIVTARPKARGWYPDDSLLVNDSSNRGHAVTPRYSWNSLERQDYQFLYRTRDPGTGAIYERSYTQSIGPGNTNRGWDPAVSPAIVQAYNSHGRSGTLGYPITLVTHVVNGQNWGKYYVQVFTGGGLSECALVYNPDNLERIAHPIQGRFWQWYRDNRGPDYIMPNTFPLGSPISNEVYWKTDAPLSYMGPEAKQEFENGYLYWDGANVFIRENVSKDSYHITSAGGSSPLSIIGWPVSNSQVVFIIQNGIDLGGDAWWAIFQDGVQVIATRLRDATITNLTPGTTHTYWVTVVDTVYGTLERSDDLTITLPPANSFYLKVRLDSENSTYLQIVNERFLVVPAFAIYRNGVEIARTSGMEFSDNMLDYNTTYTYKAVALTASNLVLGETKEVSITTGSPPVVLPPPPPPPENISIPLALRGIGFSDPPPYTVDGFAQAYFDVVCIGQNPVLVKRLSVEGQFTYVPTGEVYERNWRPVEFNPPLTLNPGDTYHYQMRNDGWPFPGIPTKGVIKAYTVVQGIVGQYQIMQAMNGAQNYFAFDVVNAPPPVYRPNLVPSLELVSANPTDETAIELKVDVTNNGSVYCPSTTLTLGVDGVLVQTFTLPNINGNSVFSFTTNLGRLTAGSHQIVAVADPGNLVSEDNELDNVVELTFEVQKVARPDLVITQLAPTKPVFFTNENPQVGVTVTNVGQAPSALCSLRLMLSQGNPITTVEIPALSVGQSYALTITLVPFSVGDWPITALADFGQVVIESDESNNSASSFLRIVLPPGDFWDSVDDTGSGATTLNNPTATEQTHGLHSLSGTDSYDWFKVYLTSNRNYNFNTVGGTGDDYGELYSDAAGTSRVAYNDDSGGNMQFSFNYAPTATSWYYLRVRAYSIGSACSYSLKYRDLGAVPPPSANDTWDPADNTIGGAVTVANPTATEQTHGPHTLSSTDFYDWFRVYLVSGRNYNFNTMGGTGDNYGELYKGGTMVASNDDSGGNYQFTLTYRPTSSGWCYVRVRAYSAGTSCRYTLKYRDLGL